MASETLNEDLLSRVIDEFYARVRADPELGPVFNSIIRDRWGPHIRRIMSFWLMATRLRPGYRGRDFMPAHLRQPTIKAEQLPQWLKLFRATCHDLCSPQDAETLIQIAEAMAENVDISLRRRDGDAPQSPSMTLDAAGPAGGNGA